MSFFHKYPKVWPEAHISISSKLKFFLPIIPFYLMLLTHLIKYFSIYVHPRIINIWCTTQSFQSLICFYQKSCPLIVKCVHPCTHFVKTMSLSSSYNKHLSNWWNEANYTYFSSRNSLPPSFQKEIHPCSVSGFSFKSQNIFTWGLNTSVSYLDNSPPYRYWSWWVVLLVCSGLSGQLSWWGMVLGIVVLVSNSWALFLSGGELSPVGSCPRTPVYVRLCNDYCNHSK